jgi:MerR family transcriptional regulator, light-induced transcriptional regulator
MSRRPNHSNTRTAPVAAFKGMFQVGDLANRVISVLRERSNAERALLCDTLVDRLLSAITDPRGFDPDSAIEMLRAAHLSDKDIICCYIPESARHLGCRWDQSEMSFAQVTTASARLQDMVRALSSEWSERNARRSAVDQLAVLMVMCENDTHTLGCTSVAANLRLEGHSVRLILSATQLEFRKALRQDWYDLIMFSCARPQALETIAEFVKHARASIRDVPPLIMGGLVLTQSMDAKDRTGVDLATNDLQLALKLCDSRAVGKRLVAE